MGGACSTYKGEEKRIQDIGGKPRRKESTWETQLDGRIILRWIFKKCDMGGKEWIELAQDKDSWRELVNAVIKLRIL
jgi:hypothetical protein